MTRTASSTVGRPCRRAPGGRRTTVSAAWRTRCGRTCVSRRTRTCAASASSCGRSGRRWPRTSSSRPPPSSGWATPSRCVCAGRSSPAPWDCRTPGWTRYSSPKRSDGSASAAAPRQRKTAATTPCNDGPARVSCSTPGIR